MCAWMAPVVRLPMAESMLSQRYATKQDEYLMDRRLHIATVYTLIGLVLLSGCQPTQPFFLHEDGDLSHLLDEATNLEYPDVETEVMADAADAHKPFSLINTAAGTAWDLTLEEAIAISLQNSKVMRSIAAVRQTRQVGQLVAGPPENLTINADFSPTIFDAAIEETGPNGVESALSQFDAQWNTSVFWDRTDRPQNVDDASDPAVIFARILDRDNVNFESELTKRAATGTQWSFRNISTYDASNRPLRVLASEWLTSFEAEARHPLMRGSGTQINRIPLLLARIRTDVSLVQFEQSVRNHLASVERAYWELYFFYRNLETAKIGRNSALLTWKRINAIYEEGGQGVSGEQEAQSREQYYFFRGRVEEAKRDLLIAERQVRYLMGIAPTDGRIIRPADEPTIARVQFDWSEILAESLTRSSEIRRQKWQVKQRELELLASKNNLLPQVDLVALYRWVGLGDDLLESNRNGLDFPEPGSTAFEGLTDGRFQEWRFGLDVQVPIGFRAEQSAVRHQQLQLARSKARLEDMELEVSHALTDAIQRLDANFALTQTAFLQRAAADRQVDVLQNKLEAGTVTLDFLLDAQRRAAEAQTQFYQSLTQYNMSIVEVHFRKGSLIDFCGVALQEGPWPAKGYFDALIRARRRDASYYFDYGYTRPSVISRGIVPQGEASIIQGHPTTVAEEMEEVPRPAESEPAVEPEKPAPAETEDVPTPAEEEPRSALRFVQIDEADSSASGAGTLELTPAGGGLDSLDQGSPRTANDFDWKGLFR